MAKQYFVLGIGGTGMRCIESLIHLCAIGMFDTTEIHLLALDTDKNNGNFSRLKALVNAYVNAKGSDPGKRTSLSDTFFSADIKYYEFSPDYEKSSTFKQVFNYDNTKHRSPLETSLADLVLTESVESFNLRHGYRAQTHLGSMMMYHSIIESARSSTDNGMKRFLQALTTATNNGTPRVFILGSVFGGTGASSIPVIPQALSRAAAIINNGTASILNKTFFGSTLLTAYFNFRSPSGDELKNQQVIATSDKFALNSQVAMMFYDDDTTVKNIYQRFYMLGMDNYSWDPMAQKKEQIKETITGGADQTNDSHYIELLAACAAWDFLRADDSDLKEKKANSKPDYVYRAIDNSDRLTFMDFVGNKDKCDEAFAKKFGMLLAFSLLCNGEDDFVEGVRSKKHREIVGFSDIDVSQVEALKKYFSLLHVQRNDDGSLGDGWLRQLHRSAGLGDRCLFAPDLFAFTNMKQMARYKWNSTLYRSDGVGKDWTFSVGVFGSRFDTFKKEFIKVLNDDKRSAAAKAIVNPGEKLYKLIYTTLCAIYGIE